MLCTTDVSTGKGSGITPRKSYLSVFALPPIHCPKLLPIAAPRTPSLPLNIKVPNDRWLHKPVRAPLCGLSRHQTVAMKQHRRFAERGDLTRCHITQLKLNASDCHPVRTPRTLAYQKTFFQNFPRNCAGGRNKRWTLEAGRELTVTHLSSVRITSCSIVAQSRTT